VSRTVLDVNRDPSGASLYPGQTTTELCPTTTFDGEALYLWRNRRTRTRSRRGAPNSSIPIIATLAEQIARLRRKHPKVVLYDAHSIRSVVPRLFDGELPNFNNRHQWRPDLRSGADRFGRGRFGDGSGYSRVTNGRFKGGWTTRHYGDPGGGVHAIQMELALPAAIWTSLWARRTTATGRRNMTRTGAAAIALRPHPHPDCLH